MQLNQGARIFTANGKEVGHLDRVVIDPKTKEITHIVIHQGFLFTKDKVVNVESINTGEEDRITLWMNDRDLADLPDFEETQYVLSGRSQEGGSMVSGPIGIAPAPMYSYPPHSSPNYTKQVKQNIPEETVAVKEGAKVTARDGKELGYVEQIITRAHDDHVLYFLVSIPTGLLSKEKKMIPSRWIDRLNQNEVHLAVEAKAVEKLPTLEYA
jgi:uncharacterized protein YrrD